MEIKGEYKIAAPREKVFAALNDPSVLKECIPGCESLEKLSDTEMTAKVRLRIGPVSASFTGKVTLSDIDPPNGYRIAGEGQGGVAGFAKGGAVVTLREDGADTILEYNADAQVGGKIAQVGARLITGTARKLADEFFGKFATTINNPSPAAIAGVPSSRLPPPVMAPPAAVQRGYRHWTVIGIGAAVLILVFLASR
ncbi:MAG: SRPBCC family protein [Pseudomonadota bacterium]